MGLAHLVLTCSLRYAHHKVKQNKSVSAATASSLASVMGRLINYETGKIFTVLALTQSAGIPFFLQGGTGKRYRVSAALTGHSV